MRTALILAGLLVLALPADADSYSTIDFTITGALTASGVITIDTSITSSDGESGNPIVNLTGTVDGLAIISPTPIGYTPYPYGLWSDGDISHFAPEYFIVAGDIEWLWESSPFDDFFGDGIFGPIGTNEIEYDTASLSLPSPANPIQITFAAPVPTPEPSTLVFLGMGVLGLGLLKLKHVGERSGAWAR